MKSTLYALGLFMLIATCMACIELNQECLDPISIDQVLPNASTADRGVIITGSGFAAETELFFGEEAAQYTLQGDSMMIATVPQGLVGQVVMGLFRGDCETETPFEVFSELPAFIPGSPFTPIFAAPPQNFPTDITNIWRNPVDSAHSVFLEQGPEPGTIDPTSSEGHFTNLTLNNNPAYGTYDNQANHVELIIDRSSKGQAVDTLVGSFSAPLDLAPDAQFTLVLRSKLSGHQLILFYKD